MSRDTVLITGSAGLIGSEAVRIFSSRGYRCLGIDNDLRAYFFGQEASTAWNRRRLEEEVEGYEHCELDIRDRPAVERLFRERASEFALVIHAAAQPSHDWAAREPFTDFSVNATGTLNLLELTRLHCPEAVFIFTSTNKVYGDLPNRLPLVELDSRWEVAPDHEFADHGIDESMSIDRTTHSLFGASKLAADVLCQEYGRYFGLRTGIFRGGCLTGPSHSGTQLHGFLAYLVKCAVSGAPYTIFGYKGKQVRDNIHSSDFVEALYQFFKAPRPGEVYNLGGGRHSHCSIREAIATTERLTGRKIDLTYSDRHRTGDHIWYISDFRKFRSHFPRWNLTRDVDQILEQLCAETSLRHAG